MFGRPCEDRIDNIFLMFNEVMVTVYLYVLILITDYNPSTDLYDLLSLILLSIFIVTLLANLLHFLFNFLVSLVKEVRRLRHKYCGGGRKKKGRWQR